MDYAVIRVGGKQHKVRDGETLVVDRLKTDVGGTFEPDVLLGDGTKVVVTVLAHERGPKIRIGKYRKRTGYRRHNGFRAATSRIEVTIGAGSKRAKPRAAAAPANDAPTAPADEAISTAETAAEVAPLETPETPVGLPEGYTEMTVAE